MCVPFIVATVDGNWGAWTIHSCDSTCRGFKTRRCDDPPPVRGGKICAGKDREQYGDCTGHQCVQNGKNKCFVCIIVDSAEFVF